MFFLPDTQVDDDEVAPDVTNITDNGQIDLVEELNHSWVTSTVTYGDLLRDIMTEDPGEYREWWVGTEP